MVLTIESRRSSTFALEQRIPQLQSSAEENFIFLAEHQHPSGRFEASLGRAEGKYKGKTWLRDLVNAVKFAAKPSIRVTLPQLFDPEFAKEHNLPRTADQVYRDGMIAAVRLMASPEQLKRAETRPGPVQEDEYHEMDDQQTPAIKFYTRDGKIFRDWGHNQPDSIASLLHEFANGLQMGLLELDKLGSRMPEAGFVIQKDAAFLARAKVARLRGKTMWEDQDCWEPFSTRTIAAKSLEKIIQIWPDIQADSLLKGYPLDISKGELEDSLGELEEKRKEFGFADRTTAESHPDAADLASAIVATDVELDPEEVDQIMGLALTLENRKGAYRYKGDHYKLGKAELKFVIAKVVFAKYFAKRAIRMYQQDDPYEGFRSLDHALDRINDLQDIYNEAGYYPELYSNDNRQGIYSANINDLAWTRGDLNEGLDLNIGAILAAKEYYRTHQAA